MSANSSPKELMQGILDASLTAIVVLKALRNQENKIVDFTWQLFNQRAIDIYPSLNGVIEVGKRVSELFPSILENENFQHWVHTTQTGEPYQVEYHYSQDGFNNWFRERGTKFEDGVIVSSDDITEQKERETTLLRSEALLLESQEIAQLGAFQWNEDMSEGYWTPQLFKLYGVEPYSIKVTLGLLSSLIHPADKERFFAVIDKAKTIQEPYSIEYRAVTANGSIKHLWARGRIVNGKLTGTAMDITERKLQEEKLKQSEELLLESQQIAQIGTFQMNEQGEIYWTEQMYQIFEMDPSVKITTTLIDKLIHEEDKDRFFDNVKKVLSSEQSHTVEYKLCLPNGKLKHIWSRAKMVNGKFTGTAMDVTERKELELKNTRLAHRNIDLDSFVYTASHDLRSPVSHIENLLNFLQEEMKDKQESTALYMELLHKSIIDLKTTLQDLTQVTEIHAGEKAERINLVDVIEEVKVAHQELIQEAAVSIGMDLGIAFLPIPKRHAKSLVYNLFSNALKFRSKDRPLIIQICSNLKQNRIHLSFSDNGIGIKKEDQDKVFMIFKRFNPGIAGRGVGMYLVKRIIDLNEGEIYLESQENAGTTFHIEFPVSE